MSHLQQKLFELQEIDTQLIHGQARLNTIAKEMEEPEQLRSLRDQIAAEEGKITHIQTQIKDIELQIGTIQAKYSKSTDLLYSGKVKNPKELEDLQGEVKSLESRQGDFEEKLLIEMEALDQVESKQQAAKDELLLLSEDREALVEKLTAEQQQLASALKGLMAKRKEKVGAIEKKVLVKYQKLLRSKGGVGVAKIKQNNCLACHVSIHAGLSRKVEQGEIETCPTCGRIMVSL